MAGTTLVTPALAASPLDEWIVGIGWFVGPNPDPDTDFIAFFNGGIEQFSVHLTAGRLLEVRRGATVIATGTTILPNNDWAYWEFKALIHPSAGSYELRIDGAVELSGTGLNTALGGINDADTVKFVGNTNQRFDDIYILDTVAGERADFLGPQVVEGLLPASEGDTLQWTPTPSGTHYIRVDDPAGSLDIADYVASATVGQEDLFEFADLNFITGEISGVAINTVVFLDGAGSRTMRAKYRSTTDAEGDADTFTVDSTRSQNRQVILEEDPSGTPDRWTVADINTGQFGVEVVT